MIGFIQEVLLLMDFEHIIAHIIWIKALVHWDQIRNTVGKQLWVLSLRLSGQRRPVAGTHAGSCCWHEGVFRGGSLQILCCWNYSWKRGFSPGFAEVWFHSVVLQKRVSCRKPFIWGRSAKVQTPSFSVSRARSASPRPCSLGPDPWWSPLPSSHPLALFEDPPLGKIPKAAPVSVWLVFFTGLRKCLISIIVTELFVYILPTSSL